MRSGRPYQSDGPEFRVARDGTDDDLLSGEVVLCWTNNTRHALNDNAAELEGFGNRIRRLASR